MKIYLIKKKETNVNVEKQKDPNGESYDGSHLNIQNILKSIVLIICILFSSITFYITSSSENSKEINTKKILWKGDKVTGSHEGNNKDKIRYFYLIKRK